MGSSRTRLNLEDKILWPWSRKRNLWPWPRRPLALASTMLSLNTSLSRRHCQLGPVRCSSEITLVQQIPAHSKVCPPDGLQKSLTPTTRSNLSIEWVSDEFEMYWVNGLNAFLYNVIPVLIFYTFQHVSIQLLGYLHLTITSHASHVTQSSQHRVFTYQSVFTYHLVLTTQSSHINKFSHIAAFTMQSSHINLPLHIT